MTDTTAQASAETASPSPGWYADPMAEGHERWWSGIGWTEYQQVTPLPVVETPVAPALPEIVVPVDEPLALTGYGTSGAGGVGDGRAAFGSSDHGTSGYSSRGFGRIPEVAAPPPENTFAAKGTPYAILALVVNILMIPSIGAIVYGAKGLRRASEIEAMGYPRTQSRRTASRLILAAGVVVTSFSLIAGAVAFWASLPHYDRVAVQSAVATDVLAQSGESAVVACPASVPFSTGSAFDCSVGFADGTTIWAVVSVTDSRGAFTWTYETQASGASS